MGRKRNRNKNKKAAQPQESGGNKEKKKSQQPQKETSGNKQNPTTTNSSGTGASRRGGRRIEKPQCPEGFKCHNCERNHWTIDCQRIRNEPHRYPKIDLNNGCYKCGQRGHPYLKCPVTREKCRACGGSHATDLCPFSYIPKEWHEFYDEKRQCVFYNLAGDPQTVTWNMPNPLDVILWHCDKCKILLPDSLRECVECHVVRPVTVYDESEEEDEEEDSDADDDDDDSDEESSSGQDETVEEEHGDKAGKADETTKDNAPTTLEGLVDNAPAVSA